ncbi:RNA polymerase sigma factor [Formosa sp. S-31]|uniref:RNA polymerase sigma factor n=1 Tax=Formosa sp. S-31 TaxID=2790949 RepID=UPI003EB8CBF7
MMRDYDLNILKKLKGGDASGYKELFDLYYMPLCIYALKFCDSYDAAEDIVQELFVKFWDDKIYLKLDTAISPYLFRAVKNNSLQLIQKYKKIYFEELEAQVESLIEEDQEDLSIEESRQKLLQQIETLPDKSKEVFKAIVFDNLKYKEVAEQLDISVNTVKTHYSRALKKLRESLDLIVYLLLV